MIVKGKTVIVTGGASGIGKALALRFGKEGAYVVVSDLNENAAQQVADLIQGLAVACDVTKETDVQNLVARCEAHFGPVDLFCSNAGVFFGETDLATSAENKQWQSCWDIHVMAHVYAARAVLPGMIARGEGYLLNTASAAGLLSQIGDAAYSATKHAAIGFAESLAITHGDDGINVSVICPQYVATPMLGYADDAERPKTTGLISPDQVADAVIKGIAKERFLILPHPEVEKYRQHKGDYDRWIGGMRKLRRSIIEETGGIQIEEMHKLI